MVIILLRGRFVATESLKIVEVSMKILVCALALLSPALLAAQVAVAVMPFSGDDPVKSEFQKIFTESLASGKQIAVVEQEKLKDIIKLHEQAQMVGSAYHDISKLKIAEYAVSGELSSGLLQITAVDVNSGEKVFIKSVPFADKDRRYLYQSLGASCRDAIVVAATEGKSRDVPDEAVVYMKELKKLADALAYGDEACYPFLAVYRAGKYVHPDAEHAPSVDKAKRFLKVFRPLVIRAELSFLSMERKDVFVLVTFMATKAGTKTKHQIGLVELEDGTLGMLGDLYKGL
jgi:peptidyl-tRNA hydrolase